MAGPVKQVDDGLLAALRKVVNGGLLVVATVKIDYL